MSKATLAGLIVAVAAAALPAAAASVPTRLTTSAGVDSQAVFSPDGSRIAFISNRDGQPELYVMGADGSGQTRVTNSPNTKARPVWSPDGTKIAFEQVDPTPLLCCGNRELYVVNADGSGLADLTNTQYTPGGAAADELQADWSPDGSRIVFTSTGESDLEISVMNANGTGKTDLTNSPGISEQDPSWSPDGTRIAFTATDLAAPNDDLFSMNADGTGVTRLTTDPASDTEAAWSPAGTKIAFISTRGIGDANNLFAMNADGSAQTNLAPSANDERDISWSPDGGKLAFTGFDVLTGAGDLEVVNADGTGLTNLTNSLSNEFFGSGGGRADNAVWTPGGSTLVFTSDRDEPGNLDVSTIGLGPSYAFTGFFAPVDNLPVLNAMQAGAAVPVKFSLGGFQGLDVFATGYPKSEQIVCDSSALVEGVEETVSASASGLTYDAGSDRYVYTWKTSKSWAGTCRQLVLKLNDGSFHRANFLFRK